MRRIHTRNVSFIAFVALVMALVVGCGGPEATPTATATATSVVTAPTGTIEPTAIATSGTEATPTPTATLSPFGDLFLEITSPAEAELVTNAATLQVSGRTSVDAVVSVGDAFTDVGLDGAFQATVQLMEGINIIEVVASIATGEQLGQVITVIYTP